MDLGIAGRIALVTAASRGLGRASAIALAEEGARVVICARRADALNEAEQDVREAATATGKGGEVHSIVADVADSAAPALLVKETVAHFGALHIVVANAGGPPPGASLDTDDATILAAVNTNLLATVRLVREAVPHMRAAGWGRVCAIASLTIKQPSPTLVPSNIARTGLWAWAKTAAPELFGDGITLNLTCPGYHRTDRVVELGGAPAGAPMGDPADFGRVVAFLCSEAAAFVTGVALNVDGGVTRGLL
jgi:3-oxoacyl-[acyl-carrier protein] reductase